MSFTKTGLSPVMEKVVDEILNNNGEKMCIKDFRSEIYKMRLNEKDSNEIIKFLQEKGYLVRRGKTIIRI